MPVVPVNYWKGHHIGTSNVNINVMPMMFCNRLNLHVAGYGFTFTSMIKPEVTMDINLKSL
jgi:hypothetical protein